MSEGLQGFLYGCGLLVVGAIVTAIVAYLKSKKNNKKKVVKQVEQNTSDIKTLKEETIEIKDLCKMQLLFSMVLGDGMIQSGVNGDVKKAFMKLKEDAILKI
jgi:gas vesicle protein